MVELFFILISPLLLEIAFQIDTDIFFYFSIYLLYIEFFFYLREYTKKSPSENDTFKLVIAMLLNQ